MLCGNCGKQIVDNSRFCPYCGAPVSQPENNVNISRQLNLTESGWKYGTGAIIWLALCSCMNIFNSLTLLKMGQIILLLIALVGTAGYLILWLKRDIRGFYLVCISEIIAIFANIYYGMGFFVSLLLGLINSVITLMIINKYFGIIKSSEGKTHESATYVQQTKTNSGSINYIISAAMSVLVCICLFQDWLSTNLLVANFGCSLMKMVDVVKEVGEALWYFADDSSIAFCIGVAIVFEILAYLALISEIGYCLHLIIKIVNGNNGKMILIGQIATRISFAISVMYILALLFLNIYIAVEISDSWFNGIFQFTAAPFVVAAASVVQIVFLSIEKREK